MRNEATHRQQDHRATLVTCFVAFCFEAWTGNQEMALNQIQTAINFIHKWRNEIANPPITFSTPMSAEEQQVTNLFSGLAVQLITFNATSSSIPAWSGLEKEQRRALIEMPTNFVSMKEAAKYKAVIMGYGIRIIGHLVQSYSQPGERTFPFTVAVTSKEEPGLVQVSLIIGHITQWWKAYERLSKILYANRGNIMIGAMIMKMHITTLYMTLVGILSPGETVYDSYTELFQETVILAEAVLEGEREMSTGFRYSMGVIVPLQFTAQKCRVTSIRRKAIALLLGNARRECLWDSHLFGKVMEWGASVEEMFMEKGEIPGWARVSGIARVADLQKRTATLTCRQRKSETSDEVVTRQTVVRW